MGAHLDNDVIFTIFVPSVPSEQLEKVN